MGAFKSFTFTQKFPVDLLCSSCVSLPVKVGGQDPQGLQLQPQRAGASRSIPTPHPQPVATSDTEGTSDTEQHYLLMFAREVREQLFSCCLCLQLANNML